MNPNQPNQPDRSFVTGLLLLASAAPTPPATAPVVRAPSGEQLFRDGAFRVRTIRLKARGVRVAEITPVRGTRRLKPFCVPADICGLAAGKDAWMRDITFPCDGEGCAVRAKAGDLECGLCPACYEAAGEENARLDGALAA